MKDLLVAEDRSPFVLHRCHLQKFGVGVIGKISTIPVPRLITSSKLEAYRPLVRERRDGDTVEYNAEQSHQDTEEQVSTPSHRDSKYETDINDTGHVNESLSASHQFEYKKFESEISLIMTAGNELVSNEVVVNKVEDSLDVSDVNGNGDCDRGGGDGKDESDDSSYVFVSDGGVDVVSKSDSVEEVDLFKKEENGRISVGDRLDLETNGVENEVKDVKQEACIENGSVVDVNVAVESNDVDQDVKGRVGKVIQEEMVEDGNEIADVEAKTEDIVSAVGSDAECIRDPIEGSESQDTVSQSVSLPDVTNTTDGNEIHDVEAKREDVVSAVDSDEECIQNPVESSESQVTINQSVSTPDIVNERDELVATPIPVENTNGEVMVFDGPESVSDMVEEAECEVIADGSGKSFEDLECQVAVDGLVSSGSSIKEKSEVTVDESRNPSDDLECQVTTDGKEATGSSMKEEEAQVTADEPESSGRSMKEQEKEQEAQVTVDESGNPSEDLESQATADGLKSCGSAIKEQESEVSVGSVIDNRECPVSVDESEPTGNPTEEVDASSIVMESEVDASSIVMESHGKPEEEHELLSKALEVNVEPELNHVCNGMRSGHVNESLSASHQFEDKKFEGASATESTEYPDSGAVMSEYADDLANRQVVNCDGTLDNGEIHIYGTEADESVPEHVNGSTPRKSRADMAQGEFEADEEEEAKFQFGSFSSQVEEMGRFGNVIRKKDFACYERINGKLVNIVDGLELHSNVFSLMEQRRIVDFVFELQEKGKNGKLKARTYTAPQKWMRGKGRVTIQFGCCYNYVTDRNGNPPGILHNTLVDPIPLLFKIIIKRLVKWHILPPTCVPDSCIVNIYDEGDCIPPHIDNHDFLRPFCTVSFLSECNILFGTNLKIEGPGEFSGSFPIPLPTGSVLVLNGNGADVAKHCVPAVPTKRISITFRKMDESKWPIGFVPEPDLQGLEPLPCGSDKPKDNSNLSKPKDNSNFSKPSQPSDRQTVGGNDANIFKPSQQRKIAQGDTRHSHGGSETSHGGPGGGIVQNPEQMLETKSGKPMQAPKSFGIGAKLVSRVAQIKGLEGTTNHRRADGEEDGEFIKPEEPQQQKQLPPPPPPPPLTLGLDPFDPSNLQSDTTQGKSNHTGRPGEGRSGNIGWDLNPNPNPRRSGGEKYNSNSKSPRERSHHVEEPGYTRTRSYWNKQSSLGTGSGGGYYESGRCKKGASCKYLHTPK